MKKLLSILSSFALIATAASPVVGCSLNKKVNESIDPVLEQQNFNVLNELDSVGENVKEALHITPEQFFYSKGLADDNKYISDRNQTIDGSFGASQWTFIDRLNTQLGLGLERNASVKKDVQVPSSVKTQGELLNSNYINYDVKNIDKLSNVKVKSITGSYQENGEAPHTDEEASKLALNAWKKIINIGNMSSNAFDDIEAPKDHPFKSNWEKQVAFLKGDMFVNRTYTRVVTLEYKDADGNVQSTDFTQLIMLQNTGVIKESIDSTVKSLKDFYNTNVFDSTNTELWGTLTLDKFMNLAFNKMNIFTAQSQDYSVSVNLDSNNLSRQLTDALSNANQLVNDFINSNNENIISDVFEKEINEKDSESNSDNFLSLDDSKIDISSNSFSGFPFSIREGQDASFINGKFMDQFISWAQKQKSWSNNASKDNLEIVDKDGNVLGSNFKVSKDNPELKIKAKESNYFKGMTTATLPFDDKNIQTEISNDDANKKILLGAAKHAKLRDNDFIYKTFGDINDNFFSEHWLEKKDAFISYESKAKQEEMSAVFDANAILDSIVSNLNSVVFSSKLNAYDEEKTAFKVNITDSMYNETQLTFETKKYNIGN